MRPLEEWHSWNLNIHALLPLALCLKFLLEVHFPPAPPQSFSACLNELHRQHKTQESAGLLLAGTLCQSPVSECTFARAS